MKTSAKSPVLACAALSALLPAAALATTYYVKPASEGGSDSAAGTSPATAFATPRKAVETARNKNQANEIVISPGTYALGGTPLDAYSYTGSSEAPRLVIRGATGKPADVVLDAEGLSPGVRLRYNSSLESVTVENGTNTNRTDGGFYSDYYAAGVQAGQRGGAASDASLAIVSNCVVRNCHNAFDNKYQLSAAIAVGGPAYVFGNGLFVDCVVSNNTAHRMGSGITFNNYTGDGGTALRCLVTCNTATNPAFAAASGGAVYGAGDLKKPCGHLIDCTVSRNIGIRGGIYDISHIEGCTIEGNSLVAAGANSGSAISATGRAVAATNCVIRDNSSGGGSRPVHIAVGGSSFMGCQFIGNSSSAQGGAVGVNNLTDESNTTPLTFDDCLFEGNEASFAGGAVWLRSTVVARFTRCRFFGNSVTSPNTVDTYGGGAIFLQGQTDDSWCTITNCVFGGNDARSIGGAFAHNRGSTARCQAEILDCVFTNNTSYYYGGAIEISEEQGPGHPGKGAVIRNCLIANNRTEKPHDDGAGGHSAGGGIFLYTTNDVSVVNCTIVSNETGYSQGGGVFQRYGGRLVNCIVAFNRVSNGAGGEPTSGTVWCNSAGTFLNVCFYDPDNSGMPSFLTSANGCVNADPRFTDAASGDFTLAQGSPCVNKGRTLSWMAGAFDLSGAVARISGSAPDIGCYERLVPEGTVLSIR